MIKITIRFSNEHEDLGNDFLREVLSKGGPANLTQLGKIVEKLAEDSDIDDGETYEMPYAEVKATVEGEGKLIGLLDLGTVYMTSACD